MFKSVALSIVCRHTNKRRRTGLDELFYSSFAEYVYAVSMQLHVEFRVVFAVASSASRVTSQPGCGSLSSFVFSDFVFTRTRQEHEVGTDTT